MGPQHKGLWFSKQSLNLFFFFFCPSLQITTWTNRNHRAATLKKTTPNRAKKGLGQHFLTHRCTSWSGALTCSGTCLALSGLTWQERSNWPRHKWRSGSRTGDTKLNGGKWQPSSRRLPQQPLQREWQWRYWWETTRGNITQRSCPVPLFLPYTSHSHTILICSASSLGSEETL